jgi:pyruvate dehydrogenase E1 component alpha subunit
MAALWNLPVIFVCENNGYAVSLPVSEAVAGTVTSRAEACGIAAVTVDGMNARAVNAAAIEAVQRARSGGGPSFIECITYRYAGHHTAEKSLKLTYRTPEEIDSWKAKDPLIVARQWLSDESRERVDDEVAALVTTAIEFGRSSAVPDPATATDYMYANGNDRVRGVEG